MKIILSLFAGGTLFFAAIAAEARMSAKTVVNTLREQFACDGCFEQVHARIYDERNEKFEKEFILQRLLKKNQQDVRIDITLPPRDRETILLSRFRLGDKTPRQMICRPGDRRFRKWNQAPTDTMLDTNIHLFFLHLWA